MKFSSWIVALTAIVITSTAALAQGSSQTPVIYKPKMKVNDVRLTINFIGTVDIRGNEVDAFLDTRKVLVDAVEDAVKASKKDDDVIAVEMKIEQINNLFALMQRGSLKGDAAEKVKEIMTSLQDAAKAQSNSK